MKGLLLAFLLTILLLTSTVSAIEYPKSVYYLKVKFVESGEVKILSYPDSLFKKAYIYVYIPQEDERQKVQILSVQPSTYDLVKDEYGNTQVRLTIPELKNIFSYKIETLVEVRKGYPEDNKLFINESRLIKPTPEILSKALEIGGKSLNKLAELTMWVNSYVTYDKTLEHEIKSADWVFRNRRGVCDEFSTLLISLTRAWKIPFRYVAGVAYSGRFERHGWVEFLVNSTWIQFDPTWAEANYVDATHIKLASLPDANFSEKIEFEGRNIAIDWTKPTSYKIEVLESKEESPVEVNAKLLTEKIGGGYFLLNGTVTSRECLILTLKLTSCTLDGKNVFDIPDRKNLWLCGGKETYWVGRLVTELKKGYIYTCPLTLNTEFGAFANTTIAIDPAREIESIKIFPRKIITTSNTSFTILVETSLKNFYLLYLDKIKEIEEKRKLELTSPTIEGNYGIWVIGINGSGDYSELIVSKQKFVKILEIEVPATPIQNSYYLVNITAKNIANKSLEGKLSLFFDENVLIEDVTFNPNETIRKSFNITFENIGKREIRVVLDVSEDRDVLFAEVNVVARKAKNFLEFMASMFERVVELFKNFTQFILRTF